jgi:hypothetical protein
MTDILDDYRAWSAAQPERLSTHSDGCHMWHLHCMASRLAAALAASRLTDAEREAIRFAALVYEQGGRAADTATLRGLLERLA